MIKEHDLNALYVTGPAMAAPGSWQTPIWKALTPRSIQNLAGRRRHEATVPAVFVSGRDSEPRRAGNPGSINEGGELGYSLSHAYGAAFDNPDLVVACVVGDGEAETGPLATSWHSNKFLNPVHDGAVLPILHLNGYKIAGPTVLARIPREELEALFRGLRLRAAIRRRRRPGADASADGGDAGRAIAEIRRIQQRGAGERLQRSGRAGR